MMSQARPATVRFPIIQKLGWDDPAHFQYNSWRIFVAVSAVPSLLVSISLHFLPESPKFLLSKGREGESLTVLRLMFSANTGDHRSQSPVTRLVSQKVSPHIIPSTRLPWRQTLEECLDKAGQLFSS